MKKWEYMVFDSDDVKSEGLLRGRTKRSAEELFNAFGAEGWEIVNIDWRSLEGKMAFSGIAKREKA